MKKIMKVISAGLSALIGMSVMTATASAYEILPSDYALNEENVVWTASEENGVDYSESCPVKCYEDGSIIASGNHKYALYFTPTTDYMDSLVPQQWEELCLGKFPDNTYVLYAEDEAGLESLCDKAEAWFDNGEIIYAKAAEVMTYECITDMGIKVTLKEADPDYNPQEYEYMKGVSYKAYEENKVFTISSETDNTKLAEIMTQIKNDERVESYITLGAWCCTIHTAADVVLSLQKDIIGDVTEDCSVNLYDAVEIAKYMMEMVEFDEDTLALADYNSDGDVNLYDVIDIAKTIM